MWRRAGATGIFLVLLFSLQAQTVAGTWLATYYRDQPGNKRTFFYRFYIQGTKDSIYGIGEALSADTDIKNLKPDEAKVVRRFRITSCNEKAGVFLLCAGDQVYLESGDPANLPPVFLKFQIEKKPPPLGWVNGPLVSLVPYNDGTYATVYAVKLSEEVLLLNMYEDDVQNKKEQDKIKLSIPFPFRKKVRPVPPIISAIDKRVEEIQSSIIIKENIITIDLYDNGIVDDDTVSLYVNNKILLWAKRVSNTPLHLEVQLQNGENKIVLFAHNMGTIPPNTALMIINYGAQQHKVTLSSSLSKNATVIIKRQ